MYNKYSQYNYFHTREFTEIYPTFTEFLTDYKNTYEGMQVLKEESLAITYYLLSGNYGHSHIISEDEEQFKTKMFCLIFQYGPVWETKLKIQDAIRKLDINSNDVLAGTKAIYNNADNNASTPSTDTMYELPYINSQSTTNYKLSKLDGYNKFYDSLTRDVSKEYISKFKELFIRNVASREPTVYFEEVD